VKPIRALHPIREATALNISLRTRLTLVYGSLFLVMGIILETATYLVTTQAVKARFGILLTNQPAGFVPNDDPGSQTVKIMPAQVTDAIHHQIAVQQHAILKQLVQSSAVALIAVAILAVALGYIVSGRMLRPLQQITATGQRLSESNLHERIGLTGPNDEIKKLADTFDSMLDRLHRAFDSQRRFIANASHELRTPLAINRTVIDVAAAKPGAPETVKVLAGKLLTTINRQERLLDGLLLLARSEHELQERFPIDLAALTANTIEQLTERARSAGVTLTHALRPAYTSGDLILLERAAMNLLENAIKYNSVDDARVWVRTGQVNGRAWLQIENTGTAISPDQAEAIFEPFRRLRADRVGSAQGAGLGLSIVRAIVHAHAGVVSAAPPPAGGVVITLQLPAVSPQGSALILEGSTAAGS